MSQLGQAVLGVSAGALGLGLLVAVAAVAAAARRRRVTPAQAHAFAARISERLGADRDRAGRSGTARKLSVTVHLRDGSLRVYEGASDVEVALGTGVFVNSVEDEPGLDAVDGVVIEVVR